MSEKGSIVILDEARSQWDIVRPLISVEDAKAQWDIFENLKTRLLVDEDYQTIAGKRFIKRSGFRKRGNRYLSCDDEKIKQMYTDGIMIEDIAKRLHHSPSTIHYHLKILQIKRRRRGLPLKISRLKDDISKADKAYLAGIVDGEGSIGFKADRRNTRRPYLCVVNTNHNLMTWLSNATGIPTIYKNMRLGGLHHCLPIYLWETTRTREIYGLIMQILPYLQIKQEEALAVLKYCRNRLQWERKIYGKSNGKTQGEGGD